MINMISVKFVIMLYNQIIFVTLEQIIITLRFLDLASSKFNILLNTRGIIIIGYIVYMRSTQQFELLLSCWNGSSEEKINEAQIKLTR